VLPLAKDAPALFRAVFFGPARLRGAPCGFSLVEKVGALQGSHRARPPTLAWDTAGHGWLFASSRQAVSEAGRRERIGCRTVPATGVSMLRGRSSKRAMLWGAAFAPSPR